MTLPGISVILEKISCVEGDMELFRLLGVAQGVTAVIGGGGKTTMIHTLARELAPYGRVVVCTTTHILPPSHLPVLDPPSAGELEDALERTPLLCLGAPAEEGKLTAPSLPMAELARAADYVLVEADGSRQLPIKAHLAHEPVIPAEAVKTILVVGASGLERPAREAVHRWERFCQLTGTGPEEPVTAPSLASLLRREGLGDAVFVNQAETAEALAAAGYLAEKLRRPVYAGALRKEEWICL